MPEISTPAASNRRKSPRYDMALELRFLIHGRDRRPQTGAGRSINISSSGLLFRSPLRLAPGDSITAALEWPLASPDGNLLLTIAGYVVRSEARRTAVSISRYELTPVRSRNGWMTAKPAQSKSKRRPVVSAMVLVNEDEQCLTTVVAALGRHGRPIKRVDTAQARQILKGGFPPVCLLVTRALEPFHGVELRVPILLTGDVPPHAGTGVLAAMAVVPKPFAPDQVREAVQRLWDSDARTQVS